MQKPQAAADPQGQALAYLVGVYFGDGCVPTGRTQMVVKSIDVDLIDHIVKTYLVWKPDGKFNIHAEQQHEKAFGKKELTRVTIDGGDELKQITNARTELPGIVHKYPKDFIEALLDSDGFASLVVDKSTIRFQVGIAKTNDIYHDVYKLITRSGIKCQKMQVRILPSGKILKRIRFNPASFLESCLQFHARRKQERVEKFRQMHASVSFNDYKRAP